MGNYIFTTDALVDAVTRRRRRRVLRARPRRQHHPVDGRARRGVRLRLRGERGARRDRARPRLLARRRDARRLLRRAHGPDLGRPDLQPLQRRLADPHLARAAAAREVRLRRGRAGAARRWTRWSAPASSSPAGRCAARSSRPACTCTRYALVEGSILMQGVDVGRGAVVRRAIVDKNVRIAEGARIGVDPEEDRARFHVSAGGVVVIGKGDSRRRREGSTLLTREYPPDVYGGAGVHVEYLARELAAARRRPRALLGRRPAAGAGGPPVARLPRLGRARRRGAARSPRCRRCRSTSRWRPAPRAPTSSTATRGTRTSAATSRSSCTAIPHVATVHSLEPMRPWKREQLGGGYALSSWCERTALEAADAVIAVSAGMRRDVLACYPALDPSACEVDLQRRRRRGVPARPRHRRARAPRRSTRRGPSVVFVGRITRQKGVAHLLDAALQIDPEAQLVLCAGAPDTPEIAAEVDRADGAGPRASAAT